MQLNLKPNKNPKFWYGLAMGGMALSLWLIFGSIGNLWFNRGQKPAVYQGDIKLKDDSGPPLAVYIGNITGEQVAVAVVTSQSGPASVYLVEDNHLTRRFADSRGDINDKIHLVVVNDLRPNTAYQAVICTTGECSYDFSTKQGEGSWYGIQDKSDIGRMQPKTEVNKKNFNQSEIGLKKEPILIKTGSELDWASQDLQIAYGLVNGDQATSLLIFNLQNQAGPLSSQLLSLAPAQAGWSLDLGNSRDQTWQEQFPLTDNTTVQISGVTDNLETISYSYLLKQIKDNAVKIDFTNTNQTNKPVPSTGPTIKPIKPSK